MINAFTLMNISKFINDNIIENKFNKFLFQKCVYQTGSPSHEFVPSSSQFQNVGDPCIKESPCGISLQFCETSEDSKSMS